MAQNQRITMFCTVALALLLFMINSAELKPQSRPEIRRLVEIKTVDEKGVVKAHVVAEYESTDTEAQRKWSESAGGAKRYQDDDEDSREASSGDSEAYGESYDMLANDEPSANQSSSESSGSPSLNSDSSSINSTSKPIDSNSSTVLPTTGRVDASTTSPTTVQKNDPTTTQMETTTAVPQNTSQVTTPGYKVTTITTEKPNVTSTPSTPTTRDRHHNLTTGPREVTEAKTTTITTTRVPTTSTTPRPTEITRTSKSNVTETTPFNASTTASTNSTDHGITDNKVGSTVSSGQPTSKGGSVEGQEGPETAARRKTLFGFVTVEILIALLAGALFSVLLVAFLVYRLKKRNEGSYELSETIALRPKEIDEMGKKKEVFV